MKRSHTGAAVAVVAFKKEITLRVRLLLPFLFLALVALPSFGQNAPSDPQDGPGPTPAPNAAAQTKAADPQPLPMPSMSGPLQTAVPHDFEGGKFAVTGILSGMAWTEGNHVSGDSSTHYEVSNAQIFVQKTSGWWQFYLQG